MGMAPKRSQAAAKTLGAYLADMVPRFGLPFPRALSDARRYSSSAALRDSNSSCRSCRWPMTL